MRNGHIKFRSIILRWLVCCSIPKTNPLLERNRTLKLPFLRQTRTCWLYFRRIHSFCPPYGITTLHTTTRPSVALRLPTLRFLPTPAPTSPTSLPLAQSSLRASNTLTYRLQYVPCSLRRYTRSYTITIVD